MMIVTRMMVEMVVVLVLFQGYGPSILLRPFPVEQLLSSSATILRNVQSCHPLKLDLLIFPRSHVSYHQHAAERFDYH